MTRRRLQLGAHLLEAGSVGTVLRLRPAGRYDVGFSAADGLVLTLSHCELRPALHPMRSA